MHSLNRGPMGIMLFMILFSVLYANADGNGIVKSVMKEGNNWPEEGVTLYTHHLECDHRYKFPNDDLWTFTLDIHCIATTDESGKTTLTLSINYSYHFIDSYEVTTCDREAVVNSVFPHEMKLEYPPEDEPDHIGRPTAYYIKYKTDDGKCFARKYQHGYAMPKAAERFQPEEFDCEREWSKYGNVAEFANCRVPKLPLSKTVIGYSKGKPAWTPDDKEGKKHQRLLECTFDQYSSLYDLTCVQGNKANEYFAFVTYREYLLERFTVESCTEEDIVNGIFPMKETTANPKNKVKIWVETIFFSMKDGKCYMREYPNYSSQKHKWEKAVPVPCPDVPDKWTNPSWGKAGMWRECRVPESSQGGTEEGGSGAEAEDKQSEGDNTYLSGIEKFVW